MSFRKLGVDTLATSRMRSGTSSTVAGSPTNLGQIDTETPPPTPLLHADVITSSKQAPVLGANVERAGSTKAQGQTTTTTRADQLRIAKGLKALDQKLELTREMVAQGHAVIWAFDLDNTLYDTRWRTLAIGKIFDAQNGTSYFGNSDVSRIERDGAATALAYGLPPDHAEKLKALWNVEFWNPKNVVFDAEIPSMIALAHQALAAGATLRYLSGRAESWVDDHGDTLSFRKDTLDRLQRSGLPSGDETLRLKPRPDVNTNEFKREVLMNWRDAPGKVEPHIASAVEGQKLLTAAFVTDTLRELQVIDRVVDIDYFWVRTSFELKQKPAIPRWVHPLPDVM